MADVQIAIVDQENLEVNIAVPGIQGPTGTVNAAADGTAANPSIAFASDLDTGLYRVGANSIGVSTGGVSRFVIDAAGQIETVGLGSAATPAYSWFGDQNTGIYSPGADQLAISTGGTGRLFVTANGGTILNYSVATGPLVSYASSTGGLYSYFTSGAGTINAAIDTSGTAGTLIFSTGTERARIRADGLFEVKGAGVAGSSPAFSVSGSAPASSLVVDSSGNILVKSNTSVQVANAIGAVQISNAGPSSFSVSRWSLNASQPIIALGKSRSATVGSYAPVISGDTLGDIQFAGDDGTDLQTIGAQIYAIVSGTVASNQLPTSLVFATTAVASPTPRMTIDSSGRVGIGTLSPQQNLHINTNTAGGSGGVLRLTNYSARTAGNYTSIEFANNSDYSSSALTGAYIRSINTTNSVSNDSDLVFATGSGGGAGERLRILANGNVGIGTNAPGYLLDVRRASAGDVVAFTGSTDGGRSLKFVSADNGIFLGAQWTRDIVSGSGIHAWAINGTERARITSDSYLRMAASTGGIQFNGDTAAANALDDYEEGTWTPTVVGSSTAGTVTYSLRSGYYTKIGRLVHVQAYINWTGGTGTGDLLITSLPFVVASTSQSFFPVSFGLIDNIALTASNYLTGYATQGTSYISITQSPAGGGGYSATAYDAAGHLMLSCAYYA